MKKLTALLIILVISLRGFSQLTITPGAQWVNSGPVMVTLNDENMVNNGSFIAGTSTVRFSGTADKTISGSSATTFYNLEIAKAGSNKLVLLCNINISNRVSFTSGMFDLNQKYLTLAGAAFLYNESENSRLIGPNGGEVIITLDMNAPNDNNAGNLGAVITSTSNLGTVTVRRGHKTSSGIGLTGSINRYFDIQPAANTNLNASLRFLYFDAELSLQNENNMIMYRSNDNGANWAGQSINTRNTALNYVERTGIPSLSRWTLSSTGAGPLPVIDLQFFAKRISNNKVQLNWKTSQEINNLGFYLERKKETENDFSNIGFFNSSAPGGNSNFPLQYSKIDDNSFGGKTFYRLKQQDIDGQFGYSVTRVVDGDVNKSITLKAWPIPAAGDITVSAEGIDKDILQVFDVSGKLVKQMPILNQSPLKLNSLSSGTYIIRLAGQQEIYQKIIKQ